jgi:hypothetical protein
MRRLFLIVMLLGVGISPNAAAQDSHYWDNQYGTKGELLGGLVVGSPSDLSATFYNPGWIALYGSSSVLLTTKAVEAYSIKLKGVVGRGIDPVSTTVTTSPGFLAGRFSSSSDEGWQWAYSYLQKVQFEFDATAIRVDESAAPPPEGNIWFSGEAFRKAKTNEYWYGLTLSRRIRENIGFGISPYVVHRSMSSRIQAAAQGLTSASEFGQAYGVDEFDFWNVRLLAKIGLAIDQGNLTYGITLTTPGLDILGSGSVYQTASVSGIDQDVDGTVDPPFLAANYQEDLSSSWQSPLSLAVGAAWKPAATGIYLTMEWFNSLSPRKALDPDDYISQSDGTTRTYDLFYGAQSLVNFGVAFDHEFHHRFALYGAFRSDFSSLPPEAEDTMQLASWDLWHISSGASFTFMSMEFTAGLQYSFGNGENDRFLNFNTEDHGDVVGSFGTHEITYRRLKALIGFNLGFAPAAEPDE